MIIVNQDKSVIVNFNNVEAIEIGNIEENQCKGTIYARLVSDYFYKIGEYKTEERAKEVLQEIQNAIIGNKLIKIYSNLGDIKKANRMGCVLTPVYDMPLE